MSTSFPRQISLKQSLRLASKGFSDWDTWPGFSRAAVVGCLARELIKGQYLEPSITFYILVAGFITTTWMSDIIYSTVFDFANKFDRAISILTILLSLGVMMVGLGDSAVVVLLLGALRLLVVFKYLVAGLVDSTARRIAIAFLSAGAVSAVVWFFTSVSLYLAAGAILFDLVSTLWLASYYRNQTDSRLILLPKLFAQSVFFLLASGAFVIFGREKNQSWASELFVCANLGFGFLYYFWLGDGVCLKTLQASYAEKLFQFWIVNYFLFFLSLAICIAILPFEYFSNKSFSAPEIITIGIFVLTLTVCIFIQKKITYRNPKGHKAHQSL